MRQLKLKGDTGFAKIGFLFKQANRIYPKGYNVQGFVNALDYGFLVGALAHEIKALRSGMK